MDFPVPGTQDVALIQFIYTVRVKACNDLNRISSTSGVAMRQSHRQNLHRLTRSPISLVVLSAVDRLPSDVLISY